MPNRFNIIIAGSRSFNDYAMLAQVCDNIIKNANSSKIVKIISGNSRGADILGEHYATERGYELQRIPADWNKYGKSAGPIRNSQMVAEADLLICFWDGTSKGTKHMISVAKKKNITTHIIPFAYK